MKLTFRDLLDRARGLTQLENRQTRQGTPYTRTKGYHVYGHLDLALRLSAAEDDRQAKKYLEILQAFTTVAERAGKEFDLVVFEVQGERIHMFLETEDGPGQKQSIIDFARVWNAGVNKIVKPKAGDAFKSFSIAADFGSTLVLLSSGEDESIVSLGNSANRPAKHLSRWQGSRNGHLKINVAALEVGGEDKDARWEDHDVSEVPAAVTRGHTDALLNRVTASIETTVSNYLELSAKELEPVGNAPVHRPLKKQGFAFRADYDGFSKRVQAAMAGTDQAQQILVDEFDQIMQQVPQEFADGIKGTVTIFPWSGDCAMVFPQKEQPGHYLLMDGHLRYYALKDIGINKVDCIICHEDESFTYNARISRLAPIQEHNMIMKAIKNGVAPERIAAALNLKIDYVRAMMNLLNGIHPEAVELIKDKQISQSAIRLFKKVRPLRQIEMAELMVSANIFSRAYVQALLIGTPKDQLLNPDMPKQAKGLSAEELARMEQEMKAVEPNFKAVEQTYGENVLNLTLARGYVKKLLLNAKVVRFLSSKHLDIFAEFEAVAAMETL